MVFANKASDFDISHGIATGPTPTHERPRHDLSSGRQTTVSLQPEPWANRAATIRLACTIAERSGLAASLPLPGPLHQLPGILFSILARSGVAPSRVELVVTEPMVAHCGVEGLLALSALRDVGITLVLTGFSPANVHLLRWLPIQGVILATDISDPVQLQSLIDAAHDHGLVVTAPAVDTESQRAILAGLGCDEGEGELFG